MKSILILGGSGYLGANISIKLSDSFIITATGRRNLHPQLKSLFVKHKINYVRTDLVKTRKIVDLINTHDYIVFAVPNIQPHQKRPLLHSDYFRVIRPAKKIFKHAAKKKKKIVFLSSGGAVYGTDYLEPHTEASPCRPKTKYGKYKLMLEKNLLELNSDYLSKNIILRVANPYGGTFNNIFRQGFVNSLLRNVAAGSEVEVWGDGYQIRDFIFIEDFIEFIRLIFKNPNASGVFNCGTGIGFNLIQIINIVETIIDFKVEVVFDKSYAEKIKVNVLDIGKSREIFGWNPDNDLKKNLSKLIMETEFFYT